MHLVKTDLGELKEYERMLAEANSSLEALVANRSAELQEGRRELDSFTYTVSHELRGPLFAISGVARMVLEEFGGQMPQEAARHLRRVAENAERLHMMVDRLFEFMRLPREVPCREQVDTDALVREVLDELLAGYDASRIRIELPNLPHCDADPVLLRLVFSNLLSNALKFSARRTRPRIALGAYHEGSIPVFWVKDNGAGFDMALAGNLFQAFERAHTQEEFPGVGIGLALVKRIVERHGGSVWAVSAPGEGATFHFTLAPLRRFGAGGPHPGLRAPH